MPAQQATRRDFLAAIAAGAAASRLLAAEAAARKPNVLVIVADDLGYADIGFHGCKDIPTPHLDSIARNGVRFTDGYVCASMCSPSRAGLLTGRYPQRFGHEFNPGPRGGLPTSEITLANLLKSQGYATGLVGKWHLGSEVKFRPRHRGFDEFFGFLLATHSYVKHAPAKLRSLFRDGQAVHEAEYLTDAFAREATDFITRHRSEPFFLYLAFNAVHGGPQATPKYLERFAHIADAQRRLYAAVLSAMDDAVGAVLAKLREAGLVEDTLVFFLNDNGGPTDGAIYRNDPLRGTKGTLYEGGIRVPFAVQWKGRLPAGKTYSHPVISLDIFATAAAAAGAALPRDHATDGVNLLPHLRGERPLPPHDALYWRFGSVAATRRGTWKLVRVADRPAELYDLARDVGETRDLARAQPEAAAELARALARWDGELSPPRWPPTKSERRSIAGAAVKAEEEDEQE